MATFTVTTTPAQDKALAYLVDKGITSSPDVAVQQAVTQALNDMVDRVRERQSFDLQAAFAAADPVTQQQVRTLLNATKV